MDQSINGIILSGGKSSRMGQDKGLIKYGNETLIEIAYNKLNNICEKTIVIANNKDYEKFSFDVYEDLIKDKGPAGGIYTGLSYSDTDYNLIVACDMSLLTPELFNYIIINIQSGFDAFVPIFDDQVQPLCAVYSMQCKEKFGEFIADDYLAMHKIIKKLKTKYLKIDSSIAFYSPDLFKNINYPEELPLA